MLLFIVFAVAGYFAYRQFGWPGAAGALVAYVLASILMRASQANRRRQEAERVISRKLSADEKLHLGNVSEHQKAMEDHRAQYDPELRKSRGTGP
ncbi:MAG: hypothetical protein M3Z37_09550 [Candidatus Eremiobacteraeota bacterium]|nr:hypothetical protein [Candidatus Eremiobacteraeota bacterium]